MSLPIRTTLDDIQAVCGYLAKKPTGATVKEAKAILDSKYLDGRKLTALKLWGFIEEEGDRYKLTQRGREYAKDEQGRRASILVDVVREIGPYNAIVERASHRKEKMLTAVEVAAHWHEHFKESVSTSDKTLNDQAVCFFQVAQGADLGLLTVGRKGSPTRFDFDLPSTEAFVDNLQPSNTPEDPNEQTGPENACDETTDPESDHLDKPTDHRNGSPSLGQGIFIAHGKNKKPLEQLKTILDQFKIPYKVAIDEPNLGRPISKKVRQTMESCNCAILLFTADEKLGDAEGNEIWRPSENVVFELGASGYLYEERIVIMKEDEVTFPSNYKDIGYISFEKDKLDAKTMDVLRELIGFGIVKVST